MSSVGIRNCNSCTFPFSRSLTCCPHCGRPSLYPNVDIAEQPEEKNALDSRYQDSLQDAEKRRCAWLLASMQYDEAALDLLPKENLITLGDWIGFHMRGMIELKIGNYDKAIQVFENGINDCPYILSRKYFRSALTITRLNKAEYEEAKLILEAIEETQRTVTTNILLTHVYGELKEIDKATRSYNVVPSSNPVLIEELRQEFYYRYLNIPPPAIMMMIGLSTEKLKCVCMKPS